MYICTGNSATFAIKHLIMEKDYLLDFGRSHCHVIHDFSNGLVHFTLDDKLVKDLYYSCLVNQSKSICFQKMVDLLKDLNL